MEAVEQKTVTPEVPVTRLEGYGGRVQRPSSPDFLVASMRFVDDSPIDVVRASSLVRGDERRSGGQDVSRAPYKVTSRAALAAAQQ
jgi:hypothetical protein